LLADFSRRWPVPKQRRKAIELIAESTSHENVAATRDNPAKLAPAGLMVANVMPNVRQPREITALAPQWDALGGAGRVCEVPQLFATVGDCEHAFRGLHPNNLGLERSRE
jgi:hypothetical protein